MNDIDRSKQKTDAKHKTHNRSIETWKIQKNRTNSNPLNYQPGPNKCNRSGKYRQKNKCRERGRR